MGVGMMEYLNTYPRKAKILYSLRGFIGLCISTALLALLFLKVAAECESWVEYAFCVLLVSPWVVYGCGCILSYLFFTHEKIRINTDGLYVKYWLLPWKKIEWDSLKGIYLCHYIENSRVWVYGWPVICCVNHREKEGLLNCRWKMYKLLHLFSVVTISDSEAIRNAFEEYCPMPIQDIRKKMNYCLLDEQIL